MEKFLKIRLTTWIVLCLLIGYQSLTAQTKDQLITIRMTNVSLKEVFGAIEKQTTYRFSYRDVVIDNRKDISISYENVPVSVVLNDVLKGRNLEYSIVSDRSIVISDKKTATAVAALGKFRCPVRLSAARTRINTLTSRTPTGLMRFSTIRRLHVLITSVFRALRLKFPIILVRNITRNGVW